MEQVEKLANAVAQQLEQEPLYRYPKLSEAARELFLIAYRTQTTVLWDQLRQQRSEQDIETAARELEGIGWLTRVPSPFSRTSEGASAHQQIAQFAVSETILGIIEASATTPIVVAGDPPELPPSG